MKILANTEPFMRGRVSLLICETDHDGSIKAAAEDIVMKPVEDGICMPSTMTLDTAAAQQLMDELWNCGLRPTEGSGSAGSLKATENHLQDMRRLVFKEES